MHVYTYTYTFLFLHIFMYKRTCKSIYVNTYTQKKNNDHLDPFTIIIRLLIIVGARVGPVGVT